VVEKNIYECINDKCVQQNNINNFKIHDPLRMFWNVIYKSSESNYFTEVLKSMVFYEGFKIHGS